MDFPASLILGYPLSETDAQGLFVAFEGEFFLPVSLGDGPMSVLSTVFVCLFVFLLLLLLMSG
jgi:hypothetical protein